MGTRIVEALKAYCRDHYVSLPDRLPTHVRNLINGDNGDNGDPFAFLVGAAFDRGMPWKKAWEIPYQIHRKGMLDAAKLADTPPGAIEQMLESLPTRPRYGVASGARTLKSAAGLVMEEFGGNADAIWNNASPLEASQRLQRIEGIGPGIAKMAVRILRDNWRMFRGQESQIDVNPSVHVMRVFKRAGLIADESKGAAVDAARRLNPEFPGELDWPTWEVGKQWCFATTPNCRACPLTAICPKHI